MLEREDINDEITSGDAGGIGGAWLDGRWRGTLVERPGSDLRRLDVFASCVPVLRGNSGGTVSSFVVIVCILMDQSTGCRPAELGSTAQTGGTTLEMRKYNQSSRAIGSCDRF